MAKNSKRNELLKQKRKALREAGFSGKEAGKLAHRSWDNVRKAIKGKSSKPKTQTKQQRAKENYRRMREAGLTVKEASRLRYGADETIEEAIRTGQAKPKGQQRRRRSTKYTGNQSLMVFWKDKTDFTDIEMAKDVKDGYKGESIGFLTLSARGLLGMKEGHLGDYVIVVTDDPKGMKFFYGDEYGLLYEGQAQTYKPLMVMVASMLTLLYDPFEKYMFMTELIQAVHHFSPTNANRLRKDIGVG